MAKKKNKIKTCITCYVQFEIECDEKNYEHEKSKVISKLEKFGNVSLESEEDYGDGSFGDGE